MKVARRFDHIGIAVRDGGGGAYHVRHREPDLAAARAACGGNGCLIATPPAPAPACGGPRRPWLVPPTGQLIERVEQADAA